jgi:hypothetical protein
MTTHDAPAGPASVTTMSAAASVPVPAPPSWPWRRGALFLAGAAQLVTISALTSADPLAVTWSSLLLAAVAGVLVLIAGIAGGIVHTGLFFVPALVVLAVGGVKLWREQS